jgi:hypothetical protein
MQNMKIGPGSPVTFESDAGPQRGTVAEIKTDLTNGAKIASVQVTGTLGDAPWTMPVNELRHTEAA